MELTINQKKVLEGINGRLVRGDIDTISIHLKIHRVSVSRALSLNVDSYNEDVVQVAIKLIAKREQVTKNSLAQLNAN